MPHTHSFRNDDSRLSAGNHFTTDDFCAALPQWHQAGNVARAIIETDTLIYSLWWRRGNRLQRSLVVARLARTLMMMRCSRAAGVSAHFIATGSESQAGGRHLGCDQFCVTASRLLMTSFPNNDVGRRKYTIPRRSRPRT